MEPGRPVCLMKEESEDYGLLSLSDVAKQDVEQVALLDLRFFNTDRHGGSSLLVGAKPYKLGAVDHATVLPPWWSLGEAQFGAWIGWPHVAEEPTHRLCKAAGTKGGRKGTPWGTSGQRWRHGE